MRKLKKTRHGDYEKSVVFPVWSDFKVHIVFTDDLAKSRIGRYETAGAAGDSDTGALYTRGAGGYGHLFFKKLASAEIITHEAFHAVWHLFDWAGVMAWDNETTAYHLGHLVGEITQFQAYMFGVKSRKMKR